MDRIFPIDEIGAHEFRKSDAQSENKLFKVQALLCDLGSGLSQGLPRLRLQNRGYALRFGSAFLGQALLVLRRKN